METFKFSFKAHLLLILILIPSVTIANSAEAAEQADFIYKFAQFVSWPESKNPLVFCVIGSNPVKIKLEERTKGKKINGQALEVKTGYSSQCHVVFSKMTVIRPTKHTLTISDNKGCSKEGAIFDFFRDNGKLVFSYSKEAASRFDYKISGRLQNQAKKRC
jgi:predicted glycosyltransferase